MSIRYKVVQLAKPGVKGTRDYKYYPRVYNRRKVTLRHIATEISAMGSLNEMDVYAALSGLVQVIPKFLLDNCSVDLGELGIFSLHISGEASDSPEEVTENKIKQKKVAFRPGKVFKENINSAEFTRDKSQYINLSHSRS